MAHRQGDRQITVVSESCIHGPSDLQQLQQAGAVSVGEFWIKQSDLPPAIANLYGH
ncbi:hypothetical protein H6G45_04180 [Synechocystis sp. FACHB-383]|uniref:hypothetical protein n=1 Tax=Synechocystis sp. FACHB-383 TaxID=2692864 RepID=UPI0016829A9B|nr:hypothetical protein [Synechocystis sp. FACHB-383]MBD2652707.1 hypothetical protein [Synechocystis sp. FACHB-383]